MKTLTFAALLLASSASAATFNFEAFGDGASIGGVAGREGGFWTVAPTGWLYDEGIGVSAMSPGAPYAFIDANRGGLGVCEYLRQSCNQNIPGAITSGDSMAPGEILRLTFDQTVQADFFFGDHGGPVSTIVQINGIDYATPSGIVSNLFGKTFDIESRFQNLYLKAATVAPIPLPATALLLFGSVAALGAIRAKRVTKHVADLDASVR